VKTQDFGKMRSARRRIGIKHAREYIAGDWLEGNSGKALLSGAGKRSGRIEVQ
jgi:hypothetical protein